MTTGSGIDGRRDDLSGPGPHHDPVEPLEEERQFPVLDVGHDPSYGLHPPSKRPQPYLLRAPPVWVRVVDEVKVDPTGSRSQPPT